MIIYLTSLLIFFFLVRRFSGNLLLALASALVLALQPYHFLLTRHFFQLDLTPSFHLPANLEQLRQAAYQYFNYLSPRLLFYEGDWLNPLLRLPDRGLLYRLDPLLITLGIYYLANFAPRRFNRFWFLLLITAPLPVAFTNLEVSAASAGLIVYPLAVLSGAGLYSLLSSRSLLWRLTTLAVVSFWFLELIAAAETYLLHPLT